MRELDGQNKLYLTKIYNNAVMKLKVRKNFFTSMDIIMIIEPFDDVSNPFAKFGKTNISFKVESNLMIRYAVSIKRNYV